MISCTARQLFYQNDPTTRPKVVPVTKPVTLVDFIQKKGKLITLVAIGALSCYKNERRKPQS